MEGHDRTRRLARMLLVACKSILVLEQVDEMLHDVLPDSVERFVTDIDVGVIQGPREPALGTQRNGVSEGVPTGGGASAIPESGNSRA